MKARHDTFCLIMGRMSSKKCAAWVTEELCNWSYLLQLGTNPDDGTQWVLKHNTVTKLLFLLCNILPFWGRTLQVFDLVLRVITCPMDQCWAGLRGHMQSGLFLLCISLSSPFLTFWHASLSPRSHILSCFMPQTSAPAHFLRLERSSSRHLSLATWLNSCTSFGTPLNPNLLRKLALPHSW